METFYFCDTMDPWLTPCCFDERSYQQRVKAAKKWAKGD